MRAVPGDVASKLNSAIFSKPKHDVLWISSTIPERLILGWIENSSYKWSANWTSGITVRLSVSIPLLGMSIFSNPKFEGTECCGGGMGHSMDRSMISGVRLRPVRGILCLLDSIPETGLWKTTQEPLGQRSSSR